MMAGQYNSAGHWLAQGVGRGILLHRAFLTYWYSGRVSNWLHSVVILQLQTLLDTLFAEFHLLP